MISEETKAYYDLKKRNDVRESAKRIRRQFLRYQIRNEWMVDHSARVIAVWNGTPSGTKNTIVYAKRKGVPVVNILDK